MRITSERFTRTTNEHEAERITHAHTHTHTQMDTHTHTRGWGTWGTINERVTRAAAAHPLAHESDPLTLYPATHETGQM
jgi:hypothetical protein